MPYSYRQIDPEYYSEHSKEDMVAEIKKAVQKEIDNGITFDHSLNVTVSVREGIPYDQIIKVAHEKSADFIVMGTRGRTGLEEMFLGGVASKVSRRADCPVFLVRTRNTIQKRD
jgi:nucleotide-binding universal stress UspA family protein